MVKTWQPPKKNIRGKLRSKDHKTTGGMDRKAKGQ
jgi:hypothetical protein